MARSPHQNRRLLVAGILTFVILSLVTVLGSPALAQTERIVRSHERLHFTLHLAAGRALSVCPCTRPLAAVQYEKAAIHAPTPDERWLVTSGRPQRLLDGPRDLITLAHYGGWIAVSSDEARGGLAVTGIGLVVVGVASWRRFSRQGRGPLAT